jgi:Protein tyrosine and serine/threonine kinase/Mixed lineage kinase domain-like N-terminal domain
VPSLCMLCRATSFFFRVIRLIFSLYLCITAFHLPVLRLLISNALVHWTRQAKVRLADHPFSIPSSGFHFVPEAIAKARAEAARAKAREEAAAKARAEAAAKARADVLMSTVTDLSSFHSSASNVLLETCTSSTAAESSIFGYPRDRSLLHPSMNDAVKARHCDVSWSLRCEPPHGGHHPFSVTRQYKKLFSGVKTARHEYMINANTLFQCSDPFVRSPNNISVTPFTGMLSHDNVCDLTIDLFGTGNTKVRTQLSALNAMQVCTVLAWLKFRSTWPIIKSAKSHPDNAKFTTAVRSTVFASHLVIPPSQRAALTSKISNLQAQHDAAVQSVKVQEAKAINEQIASYQAVLDSPFETYRNQHLKLCGLLRDELTSIRSELTAGPAKLHKQAQASLEKKQYQQAEQYQASAGEAKSWQPVVQAAISMLNSHLDTEFLPLNATGSMTASTIGDEKHMLSSSTSSTSSLAPSGHAPNAITADVSGQRRSSAVLARQSSFRQDLFGAAASGARILHHIVPLFGFIFECIDGIIKSAACSIANHRNVKLLAERCSSVRGYVSQIQAHVNSSDSLRTDSALLHKVYNHTQQLLVSLETCHEMIRRFSVAGWLRKLIRADAIRQDFADCNRSLTESLSELAVCSNIQVASELRRSLEFVDMDLARIQSEVNGVQADVKEMDERMQAELQLLKDKLVLVLQKKPTSYQTSMSALMSNLSLTTADGEALLRQASEMTQVGSGAFGSVYRCTLHGVTVAVKVFAAQSRHQVLDASRGVDSLSRDVEAELRALRKLDNVYLVRMVGVAHAMGKHMLVMEYVPNGTLYHLLRDDRNQFVEANIGLLDDVSSDGTSADGKSNNALAGVRKLESFSLCIADRHRIAAQVAAALVYLHANSCIHRDIKSLNILMDEELHVKLCDFGLSRFDNLQSMMTTAAGAGTPQYMAPEVWHKRAVSPSADVYAFGVLLFEIFSGMLPWSNMSGPDVYTKISQRQLVRDEMKLMLNDKSNRLSLHEVPDNVLSIVYGCVELDASKRPSMQDVAQQLSLAAADSMQ